MFVGTRWRRPMRHPIKAAIIAFGALGALAGTAGAQPYQGNGYYGQGYGQGYGQIGAMASLMVRTMVRSNYGRRAMIQRAMHPVIRRTPAMIPTMPAPIRAMARQHTTLTMRAMPPAAMAIAIPIGAARTTITTCPSSTATSSLTAAGTTGPSSGATMAAIANSGIHGGWHGGQYRGGRFGRH